METRCTRLACAVVCLVDISLELNKSADDIYIAIACRCVNWREALARQQRVTSEMVQLCAVVLCAECTKAETKC